MCEHGGPCHSSCRRCFYVVGSVAIPAPRKEEEAPNFEQDFLFLFLILLRVILALVPVLVCSLSSPPFSLSPFSRARMLINHSFVGISAAILRLASLPLPFFCLEVKKKKKKVKVKMSRCRVVRGT